MQHTSISFYVDNNKRSSGFSVPKQWVFDSEPVGFRLRSSGFSTPKQWVFGVERMSLRLRRCSASAKNIRTFLAKHIDVSVKTYDRLAPTIYMISS